MLVSHESNKDTEFEQFAHLTSCDSSQKLETIQVDLTASGSSQILLTSVQKPLSKTAPGACDSLRFISKPQVNVCEHVVTLSITFTIADISLPETKFFARWGSYDDRPENWLDIEIRAEEIERLSDSTFLLKAVFSVERRGYYGATVFAVDHLTNEKIWQGSGYADDAKFRIESDSGLLIERLAETRESHLKDAERLIFEKLDSYEEFEKAIETLASNGCRRELSRLLFEKTRDRDDVREKLSMFYKQAEKKIRSGSANGSLPRAQSLTTILGNIGVGEVVMVAPEGPHATFGGLSHVMTGLLKSLSEAGIPVSLISPIYEFEQGSKHSSVKQLLEKGIPFYGKRLKLKHVGEVDIPVGPTTRGGTPHWAQHAFRINAKVYLAEVGIMRIFLLRHEWFANYLYPNLLPDELLRRAIFLSRGAIEVMKNPLFGLHPQLILSNDWVSGLVPVLLKLDQRYSENQNLKGAKTIHLIHNCGRDYHGLIPNRFGGQDLYPMLELAPQHYDGLADPHNRGLLNLTAGAIFHLNGAVVAVSKPYAQQLLTKHGGEGLDGVVWKHRQAVFGISNAIDQINIRKVLIEKGNEALESLGLPKVEIDSLDKDSFIAHLITLKEATKRALQTKLGLEQNSGKAIISMVGRIAEQKGIDLLRGNAAGDGISVMEFLLRRFDDIQFIIAGPVVSGDRPAEAFRGLVQNLSWRYRGRVAGIYDLVPHDFALEILSASDFTLMPSRFEPGGLTQLEALTCGSLVVARNVGGLSATLRRFDDAKGEGDGFLFDEYSSTALRNTICWAVDRTRSLEFRRKLIREAASADHDWSHRVVQYISLFQHISGVLADQNQYGFLGERSPLIDHIRA